MQTVPDYQIIRSRRRTITLVITKEPALVIRAPFRVSEDYIQDLVNRKMRWIQKKLAEIAERPRRGKQFINGEKFLFLGKEYPLQFTDTLKKIRVLDKLYIPEKHEKTARKKLIEWYKIQAKKEIFESAKTIADKLNLNPSSIRVSGAMRRWGSCNSKRRVNFSWRLVMAPKDVVNYVIVHELSHLVHLDHSKAFWAKVKAILPDYKDRIKWLKNNDNMLSF